MSIDRAGATNERGIALVITLVALVLLSLLAGSLLRSVTLDKKSTTRGSRGDQALNLAEAGISEAVERIRKGDIGTTLDPKSVWQIYLATPGAVPLVGADTVAMPTWQEDSRSWLEYSTPQRGPDVLTVRYKTDAKQKAIYRFDPAKSPSVQTTSGQPIFVITSTGRTGDTRRRLVSEVIQQDVATLMRGAAVSGTAVEISRDAYLCGHNHRVDTPTWTDVSRGRDGRFGSCNDDLSRKLWELGSDDLTGAWSAGVVEHPERGAQYGVPEAFQENQLGFYKGAWDVFGMTPPEFHAMLGTPRAKPAALSGHLSGVRYYDADGDPKTFGGTVEVKDAEGEGFLYVEGDLHIKGEFVYRGLVYATGKITFDSRAWILGGVICADRLLLRGPDDEVAILFSHDAIAQGVARSVGPVLTLSWREVL